MCRGGRLLACCLDAAPFSFASVEEDMRNVVVSPNDRLMEEENAAGTRFIDDVVCFLVDELLLTNEVKFAPAAEGKNIDDDTAKITIPRALNNRPMRLILELIRPEEAIDNCILTASVETYFSSTTILAGKRPTLQEPSRPVLQGAAVCSYLP